jgi:hypothetical protein
MMVVAQKPHEPRAQPDPIGQQALRQERTQFFNPGVSHARAANVSEDRA